MRDTMINAVDAALKKGFHFVPLMSSMAIADDLLAQDIRPVHKGRWVPKATMVRSPYARNYTCSECNHDPIEPGNFCNKCGAQMEDSCVAL